MKAGSVLLKVSQRRRIKNGQVVQTKEDRKINWMAPFLSIFKRCVRQYTNHISRIAAYLFVLHFAQLSHSQVPNSCVCWIKEYSKMLMTLSMYATACEYFHQECQLLRVKKERSTFPNNKPKKIGNGRNKYNCLVIHQTIKKIEIGTQQKMRLTTIPGLVSQPAVTHISPTTLLLQLPCKASASDADAVENYLTNSECLQPSQ